MKIVLLAAVLTALALTTRAPRLLAAPVAPQTTPQTARASISLRNLSGASVTPLVKKGQRATVLLFVARDCPLSNAYAPEVGRIQRDFSPQKVLFFLVYTDPALSVNDARRHFRAYHYACGALLDPRQRLTRLAGATVTPQVAVFTPDGVRRYLGRIDNRYEELGQRRGTVTQHDLRDALTAILSGKPVPSPRTRAVGCFIPAPPRETKP